MTPRHLKGRRSEAHGLVHPGRDGSGAASTASTKPGGRARAVNVLIDREALRRRDQWHAGEEVQMLGTGKSLRGADEGPQPFQPFRHG